MMRYIFVLVVLPLVFGFLLNTINQNSTNQFITASEFFAAKSGLQNGIEESRHETNDLRHDVDKKIMVLTSQVQQMFDSLQHQIPQKETNQSDEIVQKYQELSENYTALQKRFDVLQANQMSQLNELSKCKDKVNEHDRDISALMNLKNIQPLNELSILKTQVQSFGSEVHALSDIEVYQNADGIAKLQQQIKRNSVRVAMTACINSSPTLSSGSVVRFNNIRKNIGISSISSFQNSGKFTCEYEGLYLVSSWILSNTDESQFAIYYNGQSLASAYVMYDAAPEINVGTATAIVSVELKVGDTVWVQTKNRMFVGYQVTMDSDDCGKAIDIYDKEYVIFAKEAMTTPKPNFGCVITIRSGYKDSNYQTEITPDMVDITNCEVVLYIYDEGSLPAGTTLKRLSCTSMGTGDIFYSKSGSVTFELINQDPMYQLNFDFTIKVRAFRINFNNDDVYSWDSDMVVFCDIRKCPFAIYQEYVINARADMTTSIRLNYHCVITIRYGYTDSNHGIQITQQMIDINDCGIKLNIYEGSSPGGTVLKRLSCSTKSTGILFSEYKMVTFELIIPVALYNPRNDFIIKVKAFYKFPWALNDSVAEQKPNMDNLNKTDDVSTRVGKLQQQIVSNSARVAMTACLVSSLFLSSGSV
ncbi:Hypothetical predicted protein, partial [Mytilus galloprovincialis]